MGGSTKQRYLAHLLHEAIENNDQSRVEHLEAEINSLNSDLETNFFGDHYFHCDFRRIATY